MLAYDESRMKWYFCTEIPFKSWHQQPIGNAHAPQVSNMIDVNIYDVEVAAF